MRVALVLLVACIGSAAAHKLSVSIASFKNNDEVTVHLSEVDGATGNDVVALYFAGGDPGMTRPLKYQWAVASGSHYVKKGAGTFKFNLLNQRKDVQFVFFSNVTAAGGGFLASNAKARSAVIKNAAPNAPEHGHLALTKKAGEMLIQWTTRDAGSPEARFSTNAKALARKAMGASKTYGIKDLCGVPATTDGWVEPGHLHEALMTGLKPNTRYYYKYGQPGHWSAVSSFMTAPLVGIHSTVSFIAVADLGHTEIDGSDEYDYDPSGDSLNLIPDGTTEMAAHTAIELIYDNAYQQAGSRKTTEAIARDLVAYPDKTLFLLNGDVSYARGMQTQWDVFMDQMVPIGTRVPWMLTNGNHERDFVNSGDRYNNDTYNGNYDSGGECGIVYSQRFTLPKAPGPQKVAGGYLKRAGAPGPFVGTDMTPLWYSYDHGPIHFLVYSTELDFYPGSPQYKFMEEDLAKIDRAVTPWIVLNGHRPIYTTSSGGSPPYGVVPVALDLQEALEPLLYKYAVDVSFHGHDHIYERTCPVYKEKCQANNADGSASAPVHVVVGHAGYELSWFFNPFYPDYWENISVEHGYARCEASATTFYCQMISSFSGKQMDELTLHKPVGYKPDIAAREAFANSYVSNYVPKSVFEHHGLPGKKYGSVLTPLFKDLKADYPLLESIVKSNAKMHREIDHAIERPDTIVDDCEVLKPLIELFKNKILPDPATTQFVKDSANNLVLPMFESVCKVAAHYKQGGGTAHPIDAKPMQPVPLAVAFKTANARFLAKHKPAKHMTKKHAPVKHMPSNHMPKKHG